MVSLGIQDPTWLHLWAKTSQGWKNQSPQDRCYHPLLDVAAVAGLVWDHCLDTSLRNSLERSFGGDARTHIVFLAGAHHLGKASPGFQKKVPELSENSECQFSQNDRERPHGFITARILKEVLACLLLSWPKSPEGTMVFFPDQPNP